MKKTHKDGSCTYYHSMLLSFYINQLIQACCHVFKQVEEGLEISHKVDCRQYYQIAKSIEFLDYLGETN